MKYKFTIYVIVSLCCGALLIQCNSDKYLGYSYDAQLPNNEALISGRVVDFFTNLPVSGAIIEINGQQATTNSAGTYQMAYQVAQDEGFSRAISVTITHENYFPFHTSLVIYPLDNHLDAQLVYAAPIILESSCIDSVCSVQVFDYQGVSDIDSVFTINLYYDSDSNYTFQDTLPMFLLNTIDDNTGMFQTTVPDCVATGKIITARYWILAIDKSDYRDLKMFYY